MRWDAGAGALVEEHVGGAGHHFGGNTLMVALPPSGWIPVVSVQANGHLLVGATGRPSVGDKTGIETSGELIFNLNWCCKGSSDEERCHKDGVCNLEEKINPCQVCLPLKKSFELVKKPKYKHLHFIFVRWLTLY